MDYFANGEPNVTAELEAMCKWLRDNRAVGDVVDPDHWRISKTTLQAGRIELEFHHSDGHELKMEMPVSDGLHLIGYATYSVKIANRSFDMNTGERIITRNTYSGIAERPIYKVKRKDGSSPSYTSADPEWGAW